VLSGPVRRRRWNRGSEAVGRPGGVCAGFVGLRGRAAPGFGPGADLSLAEGHGPINQLSVALRAEGSASPPLTVAPEAGFDI
jgi:hypothetical protein